MAENIYMGRQPVRAGRRIDRGAMNRDSTEIFAQLGVVLDPARPARGLSVADQQIVEIAKALSLNARVLVMDEPTAAARYSSAVTPAGRETRTATGLAAAGAPVTRGSLTVADAARASAVRARSGSEGPGVRRSPCRY